MFLAGSRSLLAGGGSKTREFGKQIETHVEVYNELDSEEEGK
jgi:hypothetical protein